MSNTVLVLGAYGNFGQRIATALTRAGLPVILAGRDRGKAEALADSLRTDFPGAEVHCAVFDVNSALPAQLQQLQPHVVINTCGPFQLADYRVAEACIEQGCHYIDLADGRDFVTGISALDERAKAAGVYVISGASTVPGLASAVVEAWGSEFSRIESLVYGISPGQQASRGLATTRAIMTYVGRPLKPFAGHPRAWGWQQIYRQAYPQLGRRWMANCEVPDLDLLPPRYGIRSIRFSAGMELSLLHLGIWFMSWLVRLGIPLNLPARATMLLRASNWFDRFGSADGGMHMLIRGRDQQDQPLLRKWFIIAREGDGPQIPTIPSIVLARKLCTGEFAGAGALPCVGLVSLEEYLAQLDGFAISTYTSTEPAQPPAS